MNPYATDKALYHVDRLASLRQGKQPNPVHVMLSLSDLCNHNCNFCAYRQPGYTSSELFGVLDDKGEITYNPNRLMPTAKAIEILEDASHLGVKAIQFTGGGEPTIHKNCSHIIQVAHALGLETALVTNGALLDERMLNALMRSSWIRISIDAGTDETYMRIRGLNNSSVFENVETNIQELVRRRNGDLTSYLYIGLGFVITRDNWREIPMAVELANHLGVDSIRFSAVFTNQDDDYFAEFGHEANALCRNAENSSQKGFTIINNFKERRDDLRIGHPKYRHCAYQHLTTFIGADLNVYACCVISYNKRGLIGSLKEQSFFELWQSQEKEDFMESFDARSCPRCQFNTRNQEMNSLIDRIPELHWNFI